jgi:tetrahydromethanopterin S-methyltransferase subunit G
MKKKEDLKNMDELDKKIEEVIERLEISAKRNRKFGRNWLLFFTIIILLSLYWIIFI